MFLSNFFFSFCLSFLLSLFYLIDSKFANQIRIMQRAKIVIEIIWIYLFGGLFDMLLILNKKCEDLVNEPEKAIELTELLTLL